MSTEKNIKLNNSVNLWLFFTFNVVLYLLFFYPELTTSIDYNLKTLLSVRTVGVVIAPIILFILNGLLTSDQKAFLVYWRFKNPLPGHRAFTVYAGKDPRVDLGRLAHLHGPLPRDPKKQNTLWYKIYRSHKDEITIYNSHKAFLLARDLSVLAFLFLLLSIAMLFLSSISKPWLYSLTVFAEFLIMVRLAQNHGRQFVRNVLALESTR